MSGRPDIYPLGPIERPESADLTLPCLVTVRYVRQRTKEQMHSARRMMPGSRYMDINEERD